MGVGPVKSNLCMLVSLKWLAVSYLCCQMAQLPLLCVCVCVCVLLTA